MVWGAICVWWCNALCLYKHTLLPLVDQLRCDCNRVSFFFILSLLLYVRLCTWALYAFISCVFFCVPAFSVVSCSHLCRIRKTQNVSTMYTLSLWVCVCMCVFSSRSYLSCHWKTFHFFYYRQAVFWCCWRSGKCVLVYACCATFSAAAAVYFSYLCSLALWKLLYVSSDVAVAVVVVVLWHSFTRHMTDGRGDSENEQNRWVRPFCTIQQQQQPRVHLNSYVLQNCN